MTVRNSEGRVVARAAGAALLASAVASPVWANNWLGGLSDDWFTAGNWSDVDVPNGTVPVVIDAMELRDHAPVISGAVGGAEYMVVGQRFEGQLTLENGGGLGSYGGADIGHSAGASGQVSVTGSGSRWRVDDRVNIGRAGQGSLQVLGGGGLLARDNVHIASHTAESRGSVLVSGSDSSFYASHELHVGAAGEGDLIVADGGTVDVRTSAIGTAAGAAGRVTVSGAGSAFLNRGNLEVGRGGDGRLSVGDGGSVESAYVYLAREADATGAAVVSGAGASWDIRENMTIGEGGTASLLIEAGASVGNRSGLVGERPGALGEVTVTGAGSHWVNSSLEVGLQGTGQLWIGDGARVSVTDGNGYIGSRAGGVGSVLVTGSDSTLDMGALPNGYLSIGRYGQGQLTVADGGLVSDTQGLVGSAESGVGEVLVTGSGSTWRNSEELFLARGSLSVMDGATVTSKDAILAQDPGATAEATVSGSDSNWTASGNMVVGKAGAASLLVEAGATVSNVDGYIGNAEGSSGSVRVTGAGSQWINSSELAIGWIGGGSLLIEEGAEVRNSLGLIGFTELGSGSVTVRGTGSSWINTAALGVGWAGDASLAITGGASVYSDGGGVGGLENASGSVSVHGSGSSWSSRDRVVLGQSGAGSLSVRDGGLVNATGIAVGGDGSGSGEVLVAGGDSALRIDGVLAVGERGEGLLTLMDGGSASAESVVIADAAGSAGTVILGAADAAPGTLDTAEVFFGEGDGKLVFDHGEGHYLFEPQFSGAGTVELLAGSTELNRGAGFSGLVSLSGGTLVASGELGGHLQVSPEAGVRGTGQLGSATVAGTLAPGNSIGTLSFGGDLKLESGAVYEVEIDAAGNSDRLHSAGGATLAGRVLVLPDGGFTLDTPYTIVTADGGIEGGFDQVDAGFLDSLFLSPELNYGSDRVDLVLAQSAPFDSVAASGNQAAVAGGIQSLGSGDPLYDSIAWLDSAAEARATFDDLSGELHASLLSTLNADSRFVRETALRRTGQRAAADGVGAWAQLFGSWGEWDGDGRALERDISGLLIGGDTRLTGGWLLGALAGYSSSSLDTPRAGGSASADQYHFGLYGSRALWQLELRLGAAYSRHSLETRRNYSVGGQRYGAESEYDARSGQLFTEVAYGIETAATRLEPFLNLTATRLDTDGFRERGGPGVLNGADTGADSGYATLGARARRDFTLGDIPAKVSGLLGWREPLGGAEVSSELNFVGGDGFAIGGPAFAGDAAVAELGVDLGIGDGGILSFLYRGQAGGNLDDQGGRIVFSGRF